ncbi:DUF5317 family protein [Actinoplanes sp. NPDC026623]|uniref:DUF5317 family protein n=1 Tax=Actinoplanes sp. NPDC026623 TaxID=3155610 RepID=UPI0033F01EF7
MPIRFLLLTIAPSAVGVALGYLLGGRLAGFRTIRVRALWLVWLAAGVQYAQYSIGGPPLLVVVFAVVLTWLAVNIPGWPRAIRAAAVVIVLGASLNGLAIALNGRMPYAPAAAGDAGLRPGARTPKNEPAGPGTRLAVLGDTIAVQPLHAVVSLGDLLIGGGTCAFVVIAMRRCRRNSPAEEVNHDPHTERAAHRHGDLHAGGAGDPALPGRRADDRGQLSIDPEPYRPMGVDR